MARSIALNHRVVAVIAVVAMVWSIVSSLSVYPHSLSYFNELAGGPKNGHLHLGASSTDWGQDMLYLKAWLDRHPEATPLHLAHEMPLIDPQAMGIKYTPVPHGPTSTSAPPDQQQTLGPQPGWHAISVNKLHSREGEFNYFSAFKPVAMAGYSMHIYHISLEEANSVRRKLGLLELTSSATLSRLP